MTALLILAAVVAVVALILFTGWVIAAIAEPDPLDSEMIQPPSEPYIKRGTPADVEE